MKLDADEIVIELHFPLPTWNVILSMTLKRRMQCKKLLRNMTSMSITYAIDSSTWTGCRSKLYWMQLWEMKEQYLSMIRPATSEKSPFRKKGATQKKPF